MGLGLGLTGAGVEVVVKVIKEMVEGVKGVQAVEAEAGAVGWKVTLNSLDAVEKVV